MKKQTRNTLFQSVEDEVLYNDIVGQICTIIDAVIPSSYPFSEESSSLTGWVAPDQNKATKDLVRRVVADALNRHTKNK